MRAVRDNIEAARDAATPLSGPSPRTTGIGLSELNRQDLGGIDERLRPGTTRLGVQVQTVGGIEEDGLPSLEQTQLVGSQDDRGEQ